MHPSRLVRTPEPRRSTVGSDNGPSSSLPHLPPPSAPGDELGRRSRGAPEPYLVKDINPGSSSSPRSLTDVGGTLYFSATDPTNGEEL